MFLAAAIGYDSMVTWLGFDWSRGDASYELGIVAKRGLELAGWVLIAAGLWAVTGRTEQPERTRTVVRLESP